MVSASTLASPFSAHSAPGAPTVRGIHAIVGYHHPSFTTAELSPAMYSKLRCATFAVLDEQGHPVCCGFFVTPCGVALVAAHNPHTWMQRDGKLRFARVATFDGPVFKLRVITSQLGSLDIAVLRVADDRPVAGYLELPSRCFRADELIGRPVSLINGSISYSAAANAANLAMDTGTINTSTPETLLYSVATMKGHSGAALLLRGDELIGLHSEGFNDLPDALSESSPSIRGIAVRLDLPAIWDAVERAKAVTVSPKSSVRRTR